MSSPSGGDARAQRKTDRAYTKATRPWYQKKRFWVPGLLAVLALTAAIAALSSPDQPASDTGDTSQQASAPAEPADAPTGQQAPPVTVTADKLISDLEENPLKAADTYKDKRVTVTGYMSNVDASGGYINLRGTEEFNLTGVQVNIGDEHRDVVTGLSNGDQVTVTGTVTGVGEVMGYSIDAESVS